MSACLMAPSASTSTRFADAAAAGHEVHAADAAGAAAWRPWRCPRSAWLAASVDAARRNHCSLAYSTCPNWWRIISCSTGRQRHRVRDRLHVQAVAAIGGQAPGGGVGMTQEPGRLQLRHHVADRGGADAQAVLHDQRVAAHRLRRGDVFLDDGPQDGLRARLQRTRAVLATRHGQSSCVRAPAGLAVVSTLSVASANRRGRIVAVRPSSVNEVVTDGTN